MAIRVGCAVSFSDQIHLSLSCFGTSIHFTNTHIHTNIHSLCCLFERPCGLCITDTFLQPPSFLLNSLAQCLLNFHFIIWSALPIYYILLHPNHTIPFYHKDMKLPLHFLDPQKSGVSFELYTLKFTVNPHDRFFKTLITKRQNAELENLRELCQTPVCYPGRPSGFET